MIALLGTAFLLYVAAGIAYGSSLTAQTDRVTRLPRTLMSVGALVHLLGIGLLCSNRGTPLFSTAVGMLSVASFGVVLLYLLAEWKTRLAALGTAAAPIAAILLFAGILRSNTRGPMEAGVRSGIISTHVLMILFSFALFALSACCALFYLWQYRHLKRPDATGWFRRLPPLQSVDRLGFLLVGLAMPLLTMGLALGIVRAATSPTGGNWLSDPHTLMSLTAWLVYSAYLGLRLIAGWHGQRLQYLLLIGLGLTLALYFLPSSTHRFIG